MRNETQLPKRGRSSGKGFDFHGPSRANVPKMRLMTISPALADATEIVKLCPSNALEQIQIGGFLLSGVADSSGSAVDR